MNLNSRKDYIEPEYVNGVHNRDGEQVIRPLTDKEKQWLNKYYEETVVTNFYHEPELKKLNKVKKSIIEDDTVKELQKEVKELSENKVTNGPRIKQLKEIIKLTKKQNEETYSDKLELIEEELQEAREEYLLYPDKEDHKKFYNDNNSRNACLFNKMRITGKLDDFKISEFDNYLAQKLDGLDIEYIPEEESDLEERLDEIFLEVIEYFKKQKS
jgi:hypothetical protein